MIPVGASLKQHGASKGAVSSFLLSTPQTGVDSILVTYSLLGWVFTVYRVVVAFVTGIVGGWIIDRFSSDRVDDKALSDSKQSMSRPAGKLSRPRHNISEIVVRGLRYGLYTLPKDIGSALALGLLLAALISTVFTSGSLEQSVLGSGILPMLIMMVVAVPMYVCATASVPIAAALIAAGVSPGAALVFLIAGPATNAATIATIWKILGRQSAIVYLSVVVLGALGAGALLDTLLTSPALSTTVHHHEMLPNWLGQGSAVFILAILLVALLPRRKKMSSDNQPAGTQLVVEGMHCSNCANAVKRAIEGQAGVTSAEVLLEEKRAVVTGSGFDMDKLIGAVEELGYKASKP